MDTPIGKEQKHRDQLLFCHLYSHRLFRTTIGEPYVKFSRSASSTTFYYDYYFYTFLTDLAYIESLPLGSGLMISPGVQCVRPMIGWKPLEVVTAGSSIILGESRNGPRIPIERFSILEQQYTDFVSIFAHVYTPHSGNSSGRTLLVERASSQ